MAESNSEKIEEADPEEHDLVLDVMLGEPGGSTFNTVVLGGTDVVVPLERDIDGDPYQDDEVWLESIDGSFRMQRYSSDPDVVADEDNDVLLYHFRHVPFGAYHVVAVVAARPITIYSGLVVRKEGAFMGDDKLTESYEPGTPNESDDDEEKGSDADADSAAAAGGEDGGSDGDDDACPPDAYEEAFDDDE